MLANAQTAAAPVALWASRAAVPRVGGGAANAMVRAAGLDAFGRDTAVFAHTATCVGS